jgi:hypothetical protein
VNTKTQKEGINSKIKAGKLNLAKTVIELLWIELIPEVLKEFIV